MVYNVPLFSLAFNFWYRQFIVLIFLKVELYIVEFFFPTQTIPTTETQYTNHEPGI